MQTKSIKSRKRNAIISSCLILALLISMAFAYLTATDSKDNVFTVGEVGIELWENFDTDNSKELDDDETYGPDEKRIEFVANETMPDLEVLKQPFIKNTGSADSYIYATVGIPKRMQNFGPVEIANSNITFELDENGTTLVPEEIFSLLGINDKDTSAEHTDGCWKLLETKDVLEDTDTVSYYLFAYVESDDEGNATNNLKALAIGDETPVIFESVKCSNFHMADVYEVYKSGDEIPEGFEVGDYKLDENGKKIPEELDIIINGYAVQTGFDVDKMGIEKPKYKKIDYEANARYDQEMDGNRPSYTSDRSFYRTSDSISKSEADVLLVDGLKAVDVNDNLQIWVNRNRSLFAVNSIGTQSFDFWGTELEFEDGFYYLGLSHADLNRHVAATPNGEMYYPCEPLDSKVLDFGSTEGKSGLVRVSEPYATAPEYLSVLRTETYSSDDINEEDWYGYATTIYRYNVNDNVAIYESENLVVAMNVLTNDEFTLADESYQFEPGLYLLNNGSPIDSSYNYKYYDYSFNDRTDIMFDDVAQNYAYLDEYQFVKISDRTDLMNGLSFYSDSSLAWEFNAILSTTSKNGYTIGYYYDTPEVITVTNVSNELSALGFDEIGTYVMYSGYRAFDYSFNQFYGVKYYDFTKIDFSDRATTEWDWKNWAYVGPSDMFYMDVTLYKSSDLSSENIGTPLCWAGDEIGYTRYSSDGNIVAVNISDPDVAVELGFPTSGFYVCTSEISFFGKIYGVGVNTTNKFDYSDISGKKTALFKDRPMLEIPNVTLDQESINIYVQADKTAWNSYWYSSYAGYRGYNGDSFLYVTNRDIADLPEDFNEGNLYVLASKIGTDFYGYTYVPKCYDTVYANDLDDEIVATYKGETFVKIGNLLTHGNFTYYKEDGNSTWLNGYEANFIEDGYYITCGCEESVYDNPDQDFVPYEVLVMEADDTFPERGCYISFEAINQFAYDEVTSVATRASFAHDFISKPTADGCIGELRSDMTKIPMVKISDDYIDLSSCVVEAILTYECEEELDVSTKVTSEMVSDNFCVVISDDFDMGIVAYSCDKDITLDGMFFEKGTWVAEGKTTAHSIRCEFKGSEPEVENDEYTIDNDVTKIEGADVDIFDYNAQNTSEETVKTMSGDYIYFDVYTFGSSIEDDFQIYDGENIIFNTTDKEPEVQGNAKIYDLENGVKLIVSKGRNWIETSILYYYDSTEQVTCALNDGIYIMGKNPDDRINVDKIDELVLCSSKTVEDGFETIPASLETVWANLFKVEE